MSASSDTRRADEEEESTQLQATRDEPQEKPSRPSCLWCVSTRECCIAALLLVVFVVLGVCYFKRQPYAAVKAGWTRLHVDIGETSPKFVELAAREITDKPRGDARVYQHAKLPNGLSVLNIQDPSTLKVAVAMAVKAGSFDDPEDLPGLAHFCEHMLFLGTAKYPEPSGFDDFMAKSGGGNNAYTAQEVTVYFGDVSKAAGGEVLSRFADFFKAPLFNRSFVQKEVKAIDSEHAKNIQTPAYRIMQALNSLASPRSPVGRFHTGNEETLFHIPRRKGQDPVDALQVYFNQHYCPEHMHFVTLGSAPVAEQLRAASKEFGSLQAHQHCGRKKRAKSRSEAWPSERLSKLMVAQGTQPQAELWLHFTLPDVSKEFRSQPLEYIDYVLGYQGPDSLSRVMQDNLGFATSCQVSFDWASTGTNVYVSATLTQLGREHLELVLDVFYSYLATLRRAGVDAALYQTIKDVMQLKWDWTEPQGPMDTASEFAERMTRLPMEALLTGDTRIDNADPAFVEQLLARFTPDNMNVAYVDPNTTEDNLFEGQLVQTLPYYGMQYSVRELSQAMPGAKKRWNAWLDGTVRASSIEKYLDERLRDAGVKVTSTAFPVPPRPIDDVPKQISLDHMKAEVQGGAGASVDEALFGPRPVQLPEREAALQEAIAFNAMKPTVAKAGKPEIWYRSGWVTTSPKVAIQLDMRPVKSPIEPEVSARDAVRLGIYSRLLAEEMAPKMVDLTATGVSYDIAVSAEGLSFTFGGFAPMLPHLVDTVLVEFNRFNRNTNLTLPSRFARIVQELREDLTTYADMPVQYALKDRNLLLTPDQGSQAEALAVLNDVTAEDAAKSTSEVVLARPLQITALAMGNLAQGEARQVVDKLWGGVAVPEGTAAWAGNGKVERVQRVVNPPGPVEVRMLNPKQGDPNDAVVLSLMHGVSTVESRVVLGLLGQIVQVLAYNELRTTRQLGYVVNAGAALLSNVHYLSVVVQGNVLRADEVESAIELVLTELMPKRLAELEEEEYDSYVESFRQELLQPPLAPTEEVTQFWGPVKQGGQCFTLRSEILQFMNSSLLTRQRLIDTWAQLVTPQQGVRKKVMVKYFAGEVPPRPRDQDARTSLEQMGLQPANVELLLRERGQTRVFDRADSTVRKQLVDAGGFYPEDLNCRFEDPGAELVMLKSAGAKRGRDSPAFLEPR